MKRMWSVDRLGGLVESGAKNKEQRYLRFGEERSENKESRDLRFGEQKAKSKEQVELSFGEKRNLFSKDRDVFFESAKNPYSLFLASIIILFTLISLSACNSNSKKAETNQQYTCSMHPQILENEPGNCPICGMDLTPVGGQHRSTHSADSILASGENLPNLETMVVENSSHSPEVSLNGNVTYNTNQVKSISARVSGRVEKSFVKYNFEPVKKGQLLLQIYSPELVAIQQELLFLKSTNDTDLLNKTKSKLSLLGVSNQQINRILQTGKADYTINIYSNYSGYLLNPNGNNQEDLQTTNQPLTISEGQYINNGDLLFKVFNDSSLWAEFYSNALESDWLKVGTALVLEINEKIIKSKVDFIQPFFKNNQNYKVIRVELDNQKRNYKIGELATAKAKASPINGIWVDEKAVYQSGEKNLVFIKTENKLKPREVKISAKADNKFLVTKGLVNGDKIAVNASYLTDSESFIQTK
ncbi:MAG TPA: HlyD family efflux transporter periplasmic adaptor subunit [Pelobium sp.]|nr:HlyD family efflux transporter periplasmic adaptor subunit [Pelobium sp.]